MAERITLHCACGKMSHLLINSMVIFLCYAAQPISEIKKQKQKQNKSEENKGSI